LGGSGLRETQSHALGVAGATEIALLATARRALGPTCRGLAWCARAAWSRR